MADKSAFWKIHEDLPRQGPGSDETTQKLFDAANADHHLKTAIDMGCGPGRASLLLATHGLDVTAIDKNDDFLQQLKQDAEAKSLSEKITTTNMSMSSVDYPDASFDLIWAEGTAYLIGWEKALMEWRRLLKSSGKLVATDCFWLTNDRSPDAIEFWKADPLMMTIEAATKIAQNAGYAVDYTYTQPDSDWFDEYYDPIERKIVVLSEMPNEEMRIALAATRQEIDVRRKYGNEYGHVGFVLRVQ